VRRAEEEDTDCSTLDGMEMFFAVALGLNESLDGDKICGALAPCRLCSSSGEDGGIDALTLLQIRPPRLWQMNMMGRCMLDLLPFFFW
jgi:hypothetical protein